MEVDVAHGVAGNSRLQKWLAVLVGISAVVAASLATLDLHSTKRYEDFSSESTRLTVSVFGKIAGSNFAATGEGISTQIALIRQIEATARQLVSTMDPQTEALETALAQADQAAAERLARLAGSVGEVPSAESGVDPLVREVIGTSVDDATALVARQNHLLDEATRYGNRSSRAVFALSLVALATVLLGLAAVMGARSGAAPLVGGAGFLLLVAVGWGLTAFLE